MIDALPRIGSEGVRLRSFRDLKRDIKDLSRGTLDFGSFLSGYRKLRNPVELTVRSKCTHAHDENDPVLQARGCQNPNGKVKAIRRTHNLRVTMGRDQWQRVAMAGDLTAFASSYTGVSGAATATSATSLTNSGAAFPTGTGLSGAATGLAGHIVVATGTNIAYGVIVSNTATVLTIDQWYNPASATGAAQTTPAATTPYIILPNMGAANWVGLSTSSAAPAATDVLRTADGLFADGTSSGVATEQNANGLTRVFLQPTSTAGGYVFTNTWTYTGSTSVTINKAVCCNSKAVAGSLLFLETLISAAATVAANGDTIQLTWTITL